MMRSLLRRPAAVVPTSTATRQALAALAPGEAGASTLTASFAQRAVDVVSGWLTARTSRRGFLVTSTVVGTALAADPFGYVLKPGTAYASICGPGNSCNSGWTVFCATINKGVNACPPGSIAAGWWKANGASLCGGKARYIIDCNAQCTNCTSPGARAGICAPSCQNCSCRCGPSGQCDQRRVCCNQFRYGQCNTHVRQVGAVWCRVVSCTPPWRFENCSTAPATDNRTVNHSSPALPQAWTPITAYYTRLGENGSVLGATIYAERAIAGGRAQRYQHGRISWSRRTGAKRTWGPIAERYERIGAEGGVLGFPRSNPMPRSNGAGKANIFQRGRISWHPEVGAWETRMQVATRYEREGGEDGWLGYPVRPTNALPNGALVSQFQNGRISYRPGLGVPKTMGLPISQALLAVGYEKGPLGFPVDHEEDAADGEGRVLRLQGGRISWHPEVGAFETRNVIADLYVELGAETGTLGYPVARQSGVAGVPGGRYSLFQNGRISYRHEIGPRWLRGPIAERYADEGGELSPLGFPTSNEYSPSSGVRRNDFEHGSISYDENSGQVTVSGG